MIVKTLRKIQSGEYLSQDEMASCMTSIMEGGWSNGQIAALLMGLSMRDESVDEITGAAKVMRDKALPINAPENAVDCCGTGGDKLGTYNISTAVAIVAAACGVPIAKHGNRSASSKSGAADVLEALGINLNVPQNKLEDALKLYNFAFLMAPRHHAAMKYVVPVRKALGVRTIFNVLGPLSNPAKTKYQLLGVFDKALVLPIAQTLNNLGAKSAWVVHGSDGLDEITTTGETYCTKLKDGKIEECTLKPADFGLSISKPENLVGGAPEENAKALLSILQGEKNAYRDIVVANTAAVLMISDKAQNLIDAAKQAQSVIDNGDAYKLLNEYIEFTRIHGEDAA
ncbi:MAG: anthranilate phosphoribosyltransferase [Alphaproteobacteria bacterium]